MTLLRALLLALSLTLVSPAVAQTGDQDWFYRGSDIARDPDWRFGTLANGLRYAVRRNALPEDQVSIRIRIDAGSLHEEDGERGWAHYVEHMLFRGTESYPDRQARQIWQQLGASFGSDSNARTSATETVYQLDLPHAERVQLDTSLQVLADMMARARFDPAAVEGERPVVLAEKARRPEINERVAEVTRTLFYAGLRYADRDPIGTDETLNNATPEGLKAFYRRWYRPDRATIVMVGDADPAMMEELIQVHFGSWQPEGPPPQDPDYGQVAEPAQPIASLAYPGVPVTATLIWMRPYEAVPHTMDRERQLLEEMVATRIINRRLEARARGEADFINASLIASRARNVSNATQLAISVRGSNWRPALEQGFAIIADAMRAPPSATEISRELQNLRTSVTAAVSGEATVRSQFRAEQLLNAIDNGSVVSTATTVLENFDRNVPLMTPDRIAAVTRALFAGSGPRLMLISPEPIQGGDQALAEGLAAARAIAPSERREERLVNFDQLPPLGPPGGEVSRQLIEDMGVTIVRFANGSSLTFKRTNFERGSVNVRLRFGNGLAGLAPDQPSLAWLGGLVGPSGLAHLDLDGMERLLTGRRMSLAFGIDEEAFVLAGQTNRADLADQLRLLTTKLTHPRWDTALFRRFHSAAVQSFDMHFASAAGRAAREVPGFIRPNDQRWRPIERDEMAAATVDQLSAYFDPLLGHGPVHAVIVGDVELETAIEAVRSTVASLPARQPLPLPPGARALRPPAPDPEPRRFTHQGDPDQAYAMIGWSTVGGRDRTRDRRALALAANMFQARLFDRLREQEGATYSPSAAHNSSEAFEAWGIFFASAEVRPASIPTFFRVAREIVAQLASVPAAPDEFQRAQNPVITGIERRLATNGYWLEAMENWVHSPRDIENVRHYLADYRALTPEDVRRAVANYVLDQGDWSMVVLPERSQPSSRQSGA
ncbi:MAG TPA: insulinase family protein [Allosphingosinicella sp.]|nr:insulinase family protein [Allosphingosinicella sp.]